MSIERGFSPQRTNELIVVGSGPAGLSAAIGGGSERLNTLVLDDRHDVGGQASLTSMIRNYPGFPHGVTGPDLMGAMTDQALGFGTQFIGPSRVTNISQTAEGLSVVTEDNEFYEAKFVLISIGVDRKPLKGRNVAAYKGRGVNYGPPSSPESYKNKRVVVIGSGNSAGQAAYKLSEYENCEVHILIKGDSIEDNMSGYLIDELQKRNVIVHTNTQLTGVDGDGKLERVGIVDNKTQESTELNASEVFVFIGAVPKTHWLPEAIRRDSQGYVLAGSGLPEDVRGEFIEQTKGRKPLAHETSMPRVFVAGDVRSGTNKRIALAVGDGTGVVPEIHELRAHR
ncbi:MAG: NAD(P)/FAD-dependent oxidoreductase [Patescibacteria group bacterium]